MSKADERQLFLFNKNRNIESFLCWMIPSANASSGKVGPPEPPPANRILTGFLLINIDSFGIPYVLSNNAPYYCSVQ